MSHETPAGLDEPLLQARQGPALDGDGQGESAQKIATVLRVTDTRREHPWLPRGAAHPFDHAAALASGHATADEGDVAGRGRGEEED